MHGLSLPARQCQTLEPVETILLVAAFGVILPLLLSGHTPVAVLLLVLHTLPTLVAKPIVISTIALISSPVAPALSILMGIFTL
mgnify:CR=1 FL=1